ncbi:TraX family protein [Lentilactobacillus kefiri]|nr:TraX family protein [Lentilactobacillus kefiri]
MGITLMFIDHIHEMFNTVGVPNWVDWFGRPVATIFFFLSVEGFIHTRNQKRYMTRLLIGFWVMQIGNMIIQHFFPMGDFALINNIFGDLFIGVLTMYGIQQISEGRKRHQQGKVWGGILAIAIPFIFGAITLVAVTAIGSHAVWAKLIMLLPSPFIAENSFMLYLGPLMYLVRKKRSWQMLAVVALAIISTGFNFSTLFTGNFQWLMFLAIIPMYFYNGQLGRSMKGFFYAFYPLHIWILYLLAWFMGVGH